jgi:hypothetical protein
LIIAVFKRDVALDIVDTEIPQIRIIGNIFIVVPVGETVIQRRRKGNKGHRRDNEAIEERRAGVFLAGKLDCFGHRSRCDEKPGLNVLSWYSVK